MVYLMGMNTPNIQLGPLSHCFLPTSGLHVSYHKLKSKKQSRGGVYVMAQGTFCVLFRYYKKRKTLCYHDRHNCDEQYWYAKYHNMPNIRLCTIYTMHLVCFYYQWCPGFNIFHLLKLPIPFSKTFLPVLSVKIRSLSSINGGKSIISYKKRTAFRCYLWKNAFLLCSVLFYYVVIFFVIWWKREHYWLCTISPFHLIFSPVSVNTPVPPCKPSVF